MSINTEHKNQRMVGAEWQTGKGYLFHQKWTAPLLKTTTKIHAAMTAGGTTVTTGITQPDFPQVLSITEGGATHTATGNVVITGTDIRGNVITDTIAMPGSAATVNGVKAFATVTSIALPAGVDAADTIAVGTTNIFGLARLLLADEYLNGSAAGTYESTRATVTYSATDISLNTVLFNTACDATKTFRANYITHELTAAPQTTA